MKKLFITGASGCVGHYVTEQLLAQGGWEIHLLVRENSKLQWRPTDHPNVILHIGNMEFIEQLKPLIQEMEYIIHIFTDWSNSDYATLLNVTKTHQLFEMTNPETLKRIVYFSTASILGARNMPIPEAGQYGPGYVRSKYFGYLKLSEHPLKDKIITVFPTLVFGGDKTHPYSHISSGILPNLRYLKILRFFYIDAKFHFLHAHDIAQCAIHLLTADTKERAFALGNPVMTGKDTIRRLCRYFKIRPYFRIKIPTKMVFFLASLFRITIAPWETYCIQNPFFEYSVVTPASFGLTTRFPTLESALDDIVNAQ
ncbi:NAD(P)-dependent oxidoreductase [bacterium]|nr:NAD(P)-dependent oxidoreductase [bacterium]